MPVYKDGLELVISEGFIDDKLKQEIIMETATQVDAEIRSGHPQVDVDDFIDYNFKRTWRKNTYESGTTIGSDYQYWNEVVDDVISMFRRFAASASPDPVANAMAKRSGILGYAGKSYPKFIQVWEGTSANMRPVSESRSLQGPRVLVGPRVDFGLFMEEWLTGDYNPIFPMYKGIGVIHAIANAVQGRWLGIHKIDVVVYKPNAGANMSVETPGRGDEKVRLFPSIAITPRHGMG